MVAKISVGNSLFGALAYNQKAIDEEKKGRVLYANLLSEKLDGTFDIHTCMTEFNMQFPENIKTDNPVVHISLNPHIDDRVTDDQFAEIAEKYMEKMGYGNQPYMVFKHEDINRHHTHIVTIGVDSNGKKISDSNNFYKSKKITRELEKEYGLRSAEKQVQPKLYRFQKVNYDDGNLKKQIANVIQPLSARYHFQSFNEYKALLSLYNISAKDVSGEIGGRKYNGIVYMATDGKGSEVGNPLKSSLFGKDVGYKSIHKRIDESKLFMKNKKLRDSTKQIVISTMNKHPNRSDFESKLAEKGIDVIFREDDAGRIYGVAFIDHNNSCVFNGSKLGKEFSANAFEQMFSNAPSVDPPQVESNSQSEQIDDLKPNEPPLQEEQAQEQQQHDDSQAPDNSSPIIDEQEPQQSGDFEPSDFPNFETQIDDKPQQGQHYEQTDNGEGLLGGDLDLLSDSNGINHEEEQFINKMKRKKKKGRRL